MPKHPPVAQLRTPRHRGVAGYGHRPPATGDEVHAAALQYVRKVAGTTRPSQANQEAFDEAVAGVGPAPPHLPRHLTTNAPPKDRDVEAAKARARSAQRFAKVG